MWLSWCLKQHESRGSAWSECSLTTMARPDDVALETRAVNAFGDMGLNARTRIIRDRFIAGHPISALRRYLDSVSPETPIRDIVDRYRVWESHADTDDRRVVKPTLERAQPVYAASESLLGPPEQIVEAVNGPLVGLADIETMLKRLFPAVPAQSPAPRPAPTELEAMLKRLLPGTLTQAPSPVRRQSAGSGLWYCASPVAITATGQVDARHWT